MSNSIVLIARAVLCLSLALTVVCAQEPGPPRLRIVIIEGQGAIQNINRNTSFEPVVEVQDLDGTPISGAAVTFTLPAVGPGGVFTDGGRVLMTHTGPDGRAVARGFRSNRTTGPFEIRVTASKDRATGSAVISQTNAAPAEAERGSARKWAIILGVVGGAVAAGAIAATSGGGGAAAATPPGAGDVPAGTITPGVPGFGPPR
jgi:hypothetical protein